ncbi:MAG: DNA-directed DNA polymerase I, partial [Candidatus Thorarchaeota archaeon]
LDDDVMSQFAEIFSEDKGIARVINEYAPLFFTEVPDIRRLAVDIEVYTPVKNRIPDANTSPYPVTAIGLSDNEDFHKCFVLRRKGIDEGTKSTGYPAELDIVYFDSEADMLVEAFRIIDQYPIVLTFVGDAFDLNYMYHRAERLKIDLERYCPIRMGRGNEIALLNQGVHVDLYRFLKNPSIRLYALSGAYERTNLDSIAKGLLDIGKLELSTDISSLPYYELAHYCWLDANITLRITSYDNNLLLRLIILLMRISRLSMEDVTRLGISSWIQSLFRQEHRSRGNLIPRPADIETMKSSDAQTEAMIKDKRFKGAIVIEPIAGVHFNATVLDFASLYPTIMKRHNISYETVDCPHEECRIAENNKVPETDHWICTKRTGMISQTIGFFRDTRVDWFKSKSKDKSLEERTRNWYTVVEKALKVFVNASYGVTGAQHFELFCMPAAESVTAYGRDAILRTKEKAESMGVRVLYGDTDSVFLDSPTIEQQEELIRWSSEALKIDLEVEKTYKYVALSDRKKNYIGVYTSGYVEVKGLSGKKRNTPDFAQVAFQDMLEVLSRVDNSEGFETAKDEIREIINCVLDRLEGKTESYTPEDLTFRVQMTKSLDQYGDTKPMHVRAAQMLKDAGYDVPAGTIVEYIKVKGRDDILPVQMAKETDFWLDKDRYIDTLRSVFDQVLDSVGLNFDEMLGFTTLDQFF